MRAILKIIMYVFFTYVFLIHVNSCVNKICIEEVEELPKIKYETIKRSSKQKRDYNIEEINYELSEASEIESNEEAEVKENYKLISLGEFRLTAYCPCKKCCGKWSGGATASGVMPKANHTIAVDTDVIPFGTEVMINGNVYVAEDTGSAINGNRIDVYFNTHQEALEFGVQYAEVFVVKN